MIGGCSDTIEKPKAVNGVLDLSQWSFEEKGPVELDGEWEFYWEQLLMTEEPRPVQEESLDKAYIPVPQTWNTHEIRGKGKTGYGYGSYRLQVILPDYEKVHALRVSSIATSHEVWIDGKLVSVRGKVGVDQNTTHSNVRPNIIYFSADQPKIEIIIQVSNFMHKKGGIWQSLLIGSNEQVRKIYDFSAFLDVALFGSIFIMAFYHLALYILGKKDPSTLYFSIFCFLIGLRILLVGEKFLQQFVPGLSQEIAFKLEYLTFYLGMVVFYMFIYALFPKEMSTKGYRGVIVIGGIYSAIVCITPASIYTHMLSSFQILSVIFCIYILYVLSVAAFRRREGAGMILTGSVVFIATVINDIFYYSEMIFTGNLIAFGLFVFIFVQSIIVSVRFSKAFTTIEQMSEKLLSMDRLEMQFLQAQIKPHFLYNTLNTIMAFCRTDPEKAWELLDEFSNYLRGKFGFKSTSRYITLEKELNFVSSYLAIEKARFDERLNVEYDIRSDTAVLVPPLILQPIVENAVRHGIYPKKEGGTVTVSVEKQTEAVRIQIADNGVGMTQQQIKDLLKGKKSQQGIGLLNVHTRLKANYNQGLEIQSEPGQGTKVTIMIPHGNPAAETMKE
ncbi:Sensor histidine kinase YpdA [Clostridium formicaceticum]|nr:Sensor histidine kinase YpdA [Clostridium formicaceticum]